MRWIALFPFLLLAFAFNARSQSLDSTLSKISANYQPDKVYLQYDKSSYYAGETVWFKAYVMEGITAAMSSKNLYVDWIADNGTLLSHTVSPIVDGATNGQFDLPGDYKSDFVHVRAYTRWMLNFDTAFVYSKDIRILPQDQIFRKTPVAINPSLQFFPEGGDMVTGVKNTVAFKANDQFGRPVKIKGKLLDNKGSLIQSFSSIHDGMGSFSFIPHEGTSYVARWTDEKNNEHTSELPSAKSSGITMNITMEPGKRIITINASDHIDGALKQLHMVGTMSQSLVFKNDVSLAENTSAKRIIPTGGLTSGILTITLFDANWNAVAERIMFVNNHEYSFQTEMEVQRWGLGKRKRNEIEITLPDSLQGANLSIAVTDAAIDRDTTDNIISHFLLSSEIKGKVYNPSYYFSNNSDSVAQNLDLVMLTNGWRRFKWEDIVKGRLPQIKYPHDSSFLYLSGKVFGVTKSQLSGKESIVLIVKDTGASKMLVMNINPDGSFGDPNLILFDTVKVYYSLKSKFLKDAEAKFMTERLPAPNYTAFSKSFMYANHIYDTTGTAHHGMLASKALEMANFDRGHVMQTVVLTAKKKAPVQVLDEKYTSGLFKGGDTYQFDLVNDPLAGSYMNIFSYLQGKVAGLQINSTTNPPSLSWRGGAPAVYLDEMQTDLDMISSIPVTDVAYVKVFRPPFMGGFGGGNGAIAIYTRRGGDQTSSGKGLASNTVAGYSPVRQFYSPNYDTFDPRNDHPDIRTTIYWSPLLNYNQKSKKINLTFYNNDV
ncbi:MAG: hypothetical protein ACXVBX_16365, partial [Flavisolibacter sp.]